MPRGPSPHMAGPGGPGPRMPHPQGPHMGPRPEPPMPQRGLPGGPGPRGPHAGQPMAPGMGPRPGGFQGQMRVSWCAGMVIPAVALAFEEMRAPYASGREICVQNYGNAYQRKEIEKRMTHFKSTFSTGFIKRFSEKNVVHKWWYFNRDIMLPKSFESNDEPRPEFNADFPQIPSWFSLKSKKGQEQIFSSVCFSNDVLTWFPKLGPPYLFLPWWWPLTTLLHEIY